MLLKDGNSLIISILHHFFFVIDCCWRNEGAEEDDLTSERCLEKEYRSQIAIDYDGPKFDDGFYADTIELWYYFGGYFKGSGTLYGLSKNNLETDIEEALKMMLK